MLASIAHLSFLEMETAHMISHMHQNLFSKDIFFFYNEYKLSEKGKNYLK